MKRPSAKELAAELAVCRAKVTSLEGELAAERDNWRQAEERAMRLADKIKSAISRLMGQ
jgi:hypothetical protein